MLQGNNSGSFGFLPASLTGDITEEVYRMIPPSQDGELRCLYKRTVERKKEKKPFAANVKELIYIRIMTQNSYLLTGAIYFKIKFYK